jgi:hypothetical protein
VALSASWGCWGLHVFDFGAYLDASRVTAGSHIPGTERSSAVTSGHAGAEICIQAEHGGYARIWSDTLQRRFGTVRPRVQIRGPRPFSYSKSAILEVVWSRRITAGSQFPAEHQNQGGVTVPVMGQREITALHSVATQRPKSTEAQGRTVRHPFRIPRYIGVAWSQIFTEPSKRDPVT